MDEKGADIVEDIFSQAQQSTPHASVMMSVIAWGEIYYTLVKRVGIAKATQLLDQAHQLTRLHLVPVDEPDARQAAELKAKFRIPYADAFTAALAGTQRIVATADFEHFGRIPKLRILKLPPHKS